MNPEKNYLIYCPQCWWGQWDPLSYGKEYDFSKPFFQQIDELWHSVPWPSRFAVEASLENSDYGNIVSYLKNCYLLFNSDYDEECGYSTYLERSKNSFDILMGDFCELCYESSNLFKCFKVFFSSRCNECVDIWFSRNLKNCSNCFGCINLQNKQFCIFNKQYSQKEYFEKLKTFDLQSFSSIEKYNEKFKEFSLGVPRKFAEGLNNENVSGDFIFNSKNTHESYEIGGCEDSKFCQFLFIAPTKDSYDVSMWGGDATRMYECMGVGNHQNNVRFSFACWSSSMNLEYCVRIMWQSSDLFGCIGLKGNYCILNKQYTKEQYAELLPKIKAHMDTMPYRDKKGREYKYGEFFPIELSPFDYNETLAQDYVPLTKEEAVKNVFTWKDFKEKNFKLTLLQDQIPDSILTVGDTIVKEIIECAHKGKCGEQCTTAFKVVMSELVFYRANGLPLPRLCPNCRHGQRIKQKNSLKLWHRQCMCERTGHGWHTTKCTNEFQTSYAPERPEIVYCEQCYQAEVV